MAIQIEGKRVTLRWDDDGLFITKRSNDPTEAPVKIDLNADEAIEFTDLFTMGQHAISVGGMIAYQKGQD
jgi:hypothetical protein